MNHLDGENLWESMEIFGCRSACPPRLEGFESQDHLAKLIREAGDALGSCRKDLVSLDPADYTAASVGKILDRVTWLPNFALIYPDFQRYELLN